MPMDRLPRASYDKSTEHPSTQILQYCHRPPASYSHLNIMLEDLSARYVRVVFDASMSWRSELLGPEAQTFH